MLATSLPLCDWSAQRVTHAYRQRMQIEETFRDLKSPRWGYGLTYSGSNSVMRLSNGCCSPLWRRW
ncbi:MAG: transposase [Proteobacteria bacterium]|nr:transposase [Pseudomonadota bacterium]